MTEQQESDGKTPQEQPTGHLDKLGTGGIAPETLKSAMKAFKKRLKLTSLDDDSHLGKGAFSGGHTGVYAITPPNQFPQEVWDELCRQGRLRNSGHGLYEIVKIEQG